VRLSSAYTEDHRRVHANTETGREAGDGATVACDHRFHARDRSGIPQVCTYKNEVTVCTGEIETEDPAMAESVAG
jgi:hypothetical protein